MAIDESAKRIAKHGLKSSKIIKFIGAGMAIVLVFLLGLNVGNGRISFSAGPTAANRSLPENLNYASIEDLYDLLKANYDGKLSESALLDGMKSGLIKAAGDTYTEYFSAKDAKAFDDQLGGTFTGIGAELGQNSDGNLIVVSPIEGFPASKAGLRPQDVIVTIDKQTTSDMSISEAVKHIRGQAGSKVTLQVVRNKTESLTFTITRAEIKIPSVKWELLADRVGYIDITQFSDDTSELADKAARDLLSKGAQSIVLDMRDNPGGLLTAAVDVASLWMPKGDTILTQKQGGVTIETYEATGNDPLLGVPTTVLINAGSASASEIVAGALRDNKLATLYGEKSYGKGSVQEIHKLSGGAEVKITIARWYRPNGQNIDKKGITPDKPVTMSDEDYKQKRDPQKDAAVSAAKSQMSQ